MTEREFKLQAVREKIVAALDKIRREHFVPEMLLTFVARHPTDVKCYMLISDDDELADRLTDLLTQQEKAGVEC